VFGGGLLGIALLVLINEAKTDRDPGDIKPLIVIRNIFVNQIGFYLLYLFLMFTIDIASLEPFWVHQVFTSVECSFFTKRGLVTGLGLIAAFASVSMVLTSVVQTYRNMLDYCFTIFVVHFIVVSSVQKDLPANGSWWTAIGAGLICAMGFSERLSYQLETMSYQSSLHGAKTTQRQVTNSSEEVELPRVDGEPETIVKVELEESSTFMTPTMLEESDSSTTLEESTSSQDTNLHRRKSKQMEIVQRMGSNGEVSSSPQAVKKRDSKRISKQTNSSDSTTSDTSSIKQETSDDNEGIEMKDVVLRGPSSKEKDQEGNGSQEGNGKEES